MGERRGTKALELWCRRITDGYPGVNVQNMTTSWRDGLAFCAMIHHFRPDLIDFNSLNKDDVYGNNELAFRTAEQHLGVPALLDAEDMASCAVPDRLSILTYLSQFYQTFGGSSPSRLALSRTTETAQERIARPVPESPKPKVVSRLGMRRDPCAVCGLPVFLAEKLVIDHMPYHRTCFRCARCSHQLTPGNYYETEDGEYCCETCPDEESTQRNLPKEYVETAVEHRRRESSIPDEIVAASRQRSLSDEEKTERQILKGKDAVYKLPEDAAKPSERVSHTAQMRLDFMANHLLQERNVEHSITANDDEELTKNRCIEEPPVSVLSAFPDDDDDDDDDREDDDSEDEENEEEEEEEERCGSYVSTTTKTTNSPDAETSQPHRTVDQIHPQARSSSARNIFDICADSELRQEEKEEDKPYGEVISNSSEFTKFQDVPSRERTAENFLVQKERDDVHSAQEDKLVDRTEEEKEDQHVTAIVNHDVPSDKSINDINLESKEDNTKEPSIQPGKYETTGQNLSLVQKRLKMFENQEKKEHLGKDHQVDVKGIRTKSQVERRWTVKTLAKNQGQSAPEFSPVETTGEKENSSKIADSLDSKASTNGEREIDRIIVARGSSPGAQSQEELAVCENSLNDSKKTDLKVSETDGTHDGKPPPMLSNKTTQNSRLAPAPSNESLLNSPFSGKDELITDESTTEANLSTAKGIDLSVTEDYPDDLNPFKSDDEQSDAISGAKTALDTTLHGGSSSPKTGKKTALDSSRSNRVSTNPFDSDEEPEEEEEEEEEAKKEITRNVIPPKPAARSNVAGRNTQQSVVVAPVKRKLVAPQINLNPFWSDDDDEQNSDVEGNGKTIPVPKPRTIKSTPDSATAQRKSDLNRRDHYASNTSITSSESASTPGGTYRKKKPAPKPPTAKDLFPIDQCTSPASILPDRSSLGQQAKTPRARKTKPPPPPPLSMSSPCNNSTMPSLTLTESPIKEHKSSEDRLSKPWEDEKTNKDEMNRNRQSLTCDDNQPPYSAYADKSVEGKWKRKKGPAPPRPTPHRRKIKVMSMKDVKLELDEIEMQQQGLEKQGVRLEQIIRDKCESGTQNDESSLGIDVEELVLELFALVNEKNELFRRQAELILLKRQQRLEEEHADIEYQIRCLMYRPEATKTDFDKQKEESLIQRLIEIVERRNEIVECFEMDRRREVEEDRSIHTQMGLFAAKNKNESVTSNNNDATLESKGKKSKIKDKGKEKKSKKSSKKDADKDVDETEAKLKRHNKRKWF